MSEDNKKIPEPKVKANVKKKSLAKQVANEFIVNSFADTGKYMWHNSAVPKLKRLILSLLNEGSAYMLTDKKMADTSGDDGYTPYRKASVVPAKRSVVRPVHTINEDMPFDDAPELSYYSSKTIFFYSHQEADDYVNDLKEIAKEYGVISVGRAYAQAQIVDDNYNINKIGWTLADLDKIVIKPNRYNGNRIYEICFPRYKTIKS